MLNLSTSWTSQSCGSGDELIKRLRAFDVSGIELEYRLRPAVVESMRPALRNHSPAVHSIHNYFPAPPEETGLRPGGDIFRLSHPDPEERRNAVTWTARSMEQADDLEAGVLVLHCGYVEMPHGSKQLHDFYRTGRLASETAQAFLRDRIAEKERLKPPYLDGLLMSLDRLIPLALKRNLVLGLENRFDHHELPGPDDFDSIFREFKGAPIGYWHDCGHAHAAEILGLVEPSGLLQRYGDHLVGVHLHDALGLDDHLVPGRGEIDFTLLKPYLKNDIPLVLELKPGTTDAEVVEGIRYLRTVLAV
ncbi:MAG: sugar phosphate isomerase/epimerase family protein [Thermodesulfobacteriota bacterium]